MHEKHKSKDGVGGEVHEMEAELLQHLHEERRVQRDQPHQEEGEKGYHLPSVAEYWKCSALT
jgi:hypothetical protein